MSKKVLIIDDEPDLIRLLSYNLSAQGYEPLAAKDGETGLAQAQRHLPDLIVLDVMMPGMDGWEVCKALRRDTRTAAIPILMLTARADEADKVVGLELGADDYLTKPFGLRELLARIKALLRRIGPSQQPEEVLRAGPLTIDLPRREVRVGDQSVALTTTEFNILRTLARRPGRVYSRNELIDRAIGEDVVVVDRTIDVHIAAIRRKLGEAGEIIETVRGVGYRVKDR